MIPVLLTTYNRLEYTKQALAALLESDCGQIFIIDNCSTDGTREWLIGNEWLFDKKPNTRITLMRENVGIAGAMNCFIKDIRALNYKYAGKVDNDTIIPKYFFGELLSQLITHRLDIVQAKHNLDPTVTKGKTFDEWVSNMRCPNKFPSIRFHKFVGGSGIVFRTKAITKIPETEWKLYAFRQYQKDHSYLRKAFCTSVEVKLLDGGGRYDDYVDYYKETRRIC